MKDKYNELGTRLARELFTNGSAERAQRLVLTIDEPVRRDLGGWAEVVVADRIADFLRANFEGKG